jgi:glycosyltransferase involved in cell wall biosynthesis
LQQDFQKHGQVKRGDPTILLIANFLSMSGKARSVTEDLADRLREADYELITASHYDNGLLRGAHMVVTAALRKGKCDASVVELYSGRAFLWGEAVSEILKATGKPFALILHGGNLPAFAAQWPRRVRRLLNLATVVTTPSRYLFEQMRPYRGDLCLLPNPVDLPAYQYRQRIQPRPHLVWLRSFHKIYNPSLAPRTLALVKKDFPDVQLTMVGPDKGDGSLQQTRATAVSLGVKDSLRIIGGVIKTDVPRWLNEGDIFLNTTDIDNTPVSILEAMACGLCVVSTNVGGIPYLLKHEDDALLVPPGDEEAMAAAVHRILTEPALAERLSRNARSKAEQFDWSIIFPQWERLLGSLIEGPALGQC